MPFLTLVLLETTSLPSWGSGKTCKHSTLPKSHLWDFTRCVVVWPWFYLAIDIQVECQLNSRKKMYILISQNPRNEISIWEKCTWNFIIKTKLVDAGTFMSKEMCQFRERVGTLGWGENRMWCQLFEPFLNPITFFTVEIIQHFERIFLQRAPFTWYFNICGYQWGYVVDVVSLKPSNSMYLQLQMLMLELRRTFCQSSTSPLHFYL